MYMCVSINIYIYIFFFFFYYNKYKILPQNITSIKRKKKHNIKNRKLNCSLHTNKTNNTNKLIQIS